MRDEDLIKHIYTDYANWHIKNLEPQGERVDTTTKLYEVLIVDSRVDDTGIDPVNVFNVRAKTSEEARMRALLRSQYDEKDVKYLDIIDRAIATVMPYTKPED